MSGSRYPRRCRNGHEITGPDDERLERGPGRTFLTCRVCRMADRRRHNQRRVESGKHAEAALRWKRRQAEARDERLAAELGLGPVGKLRRIPQTGDETKTKSTDT